jgi:hypothetical protein
MFVEAGEPIEVPEIYKRDVSSCFNVPVEELEIKDIFEIPQPNGRNRVLPWSDTEGVWSVVHWAIEPVSNYTVIGRAHGDDEATTIVFNDCTRSEALKKFAEDLRPNPDHLAILRENADTPDWDGVYIDAVINSSAPMTLA